MFMLKVPMKMLLRVWYRIIYCVTKVTNSVKSWELKKNMSACIFLNFARNRLVLKSTSRRYNRGNSCFVHVFLLVLLGITVYEARPFPSLCFSILFSFYFSPVFFPSLSLSLSLFFNFMRRELDRAVVFYNCYIRLCAVLKAIFVCQREGLRLVLRDESGGLWAVMVLFCNYIVPYPELIIPPWTLLIL